MRGAILEWLAAGLAAGVVGVILLAAVAGWGERVTRWQKRGLLLTAAGLMIGAYDRLLGRPVGMGDVAFMGGLLLYLVARHGKHILKRADRFDGVADGRLRVRKQ